MPQLTPVTLDRRSDSAVVTFTPSEIRDNVAHLVNNTGVPIGSPRLGASLRYNGNRYKAMLTLSVPVVQTETINGVAKPKVVRSNYATIEFNFSNESSEAERDNVVGFVESLLGKPQTMIDAMLTDLENVY